MATQTTKVKNGKIALPKKFCKSWKGAEVFIEVSGDTISIKRLTKPALTFKEMMNEFRQVARETKLSKKEVEKVLRRVRRETYK